MFLFLLLVLQPGLRAGEASLWFGAALGALALYTSATSDPLSIIYLSVSLPPCVAQCLYIYIYICVYVFVCTHVNHPSVSLLLVHCRNFFSIVYSPSHKVACVPMYSEDYHWIFKVNSLCPVKLQAVRIDSHADLMRGGENNIFLCIIVFCNY